MLLHDPLSVHPIRDFRDSRDSSSASTPCVVTPFFHSRSGARRRGGTHQEGHAATCFLEGFLEGSSKEVFLGRVLRRHMEGVLGRVLGMGGGVYQCGASRCTRHDFAHA